MAQCPECGWSEWETEDRWQPLGSKCWYEYVSCFNCGWHYWLQCWRVFNGTEIVVAYDVIDKSVVNGLKRIDTDKPSPEQLRNFWGGAT